MVNNTQTPFKVPVIDFSGKDLTPGTSDWVSTSNEVRQALEDCGCFEAAYGKGAVNLFLAYERSTSPLYSSSFCGTGGRDDAGLNRPWRRGCGGDRRRRESAKISYSPLRHKDLDHEWPAIGSDLDGEVSGGTAVRRRQELRILVRVRNLPASETIYSYSKQIAELDQMVTRMVFDNFGVEKYHKSHVEASTYILRVIKYRDPQSSETNIGCGAHADMSFTTILHQNQVSGLQIKTKDGEWIDVAPSTDSSFIVMAGYPFTVWSNGKVHAPVHQVVMKGDKTRYSVALFSYGTGVIQPPEEFIDEEHPLKYKPFDNIQSAVFFTKSKGSLPTQ
ncbi:hypothetical protein RJ640_030654 [Escallonia rubra]|uniref:Fe2OG dioxygenase domain-containing protein n=1 Tax=Escallonia rubra TaxID=112253 RepID=A0AA88QYE8_9ASTE|nr:hypothetical protein RJ640_030654 [Escallonia rubra]